MQVEVIHVDARGVTSIALVLRDASTVADALEASGIVARLGLEAGSWSVGVYGKRAALTRPLRDGDRVEIYRPLRIDPGEARRRRADVKRSRGA